jgi:hypothetical protein
MVRRCHPWLPFGLTQRRLESTSSSEWPYRSPPLSDRQPSIEAPRAAAPTFATTAFGSPRRSSAPLSQQEVSHVLVDQQALEQEPGFGRRSGWVRRWRWWLDLRFVRVAVRPRFTGY